MNPQLTPEQEALHQTVLQLVSEKISLMAQTIALHRQVQSLLDRLPKDADPAEPDPA